MAMVIGPYWFAGGWPSIYDGGDCVKYCDGGAETPGVPWGGCIKVKIPRLNAETGFDPELCDTICLPTGTHCGITIKEEPLTAWSGSCPQTQGLDTWITQTCWAETLNTCVDDRDYCEEIIVTPDIAIRAREDFPGAIVDYECSDKAIKIHLSQWQTLYDTPRTDL